MNIKYEVKEVFGGIPNGIVYDIEDTPETEKAWQNLRKAFSVKFKELSLGAHYTFGDWHHGSMHVYVYMHNCNFIASDFLGKVMQLIQAHSFPAYFRFECFDSKNSIGRFMVLKDSVVFNSTCKESGLLRDLVG